VLRPLKPDKPVSASPVSGKRGGTGLWLRLNADGRGFGQKPALLLRTQTFDKRMGIVVLQGSVSDSESEIHRHGCQEHPETEAWARGTLQRVGLSRQASDIDR
jgi:hypothetical protein